MSYQRYAEELSKRFVHNHEETERILKYFFQILGRDLAGGGRIFFRGFGSFKRVKKKPRKYRDINTGKIKTSSGKKDVEFKASKKLLRSI